MNGVVEMNGSGSGRSSDELSKMVVLLGVPAKYVAKHIIDSDLGGLQHGARSASRARSME
jgi:hypothetical protein